MPQATMPTYWISRYYSDATNQRRDKPEPTFRKDVPAQPVDATPLWSVDLTMGSSGPIVWACGSLLPKQDAFSLRLCSRTF
jgi:hypothetical protein